MGAGQVGTQLASQFIEEKHNVVVIESDEERARHVSNRMDCIVLNAEGNSVSALEEADISKTDALVCVTGSDEVNIIICSLAARYPNLFRIAMVRNEDYIQRYFGGNSAEGKSSSLGVDYFIHPDAEAARRVLDAVEHGAVGNIMSFAGTSYMLGAVDITEGTVFDGLIIRDFHSHMSMDCLVALIERKQEHIIPSGETQIAAGDRIYLLAKEHELFAGFKLAGYREKPISRIGIVGGGRLGSLIAAGIFSNEPAGTVNASKNKNVLRSFLKNLKPKKFKNVTIIEQNKNICKELADKFPEALILNDDISDESFIAEEQMDKLDLIIASTNNQELNIITAVYLKSRGVSRAIATVNSTGLAAVARRLGVDVVIPIKSVVIDSIMSRLMGGNIKGVHSFAEGTLTILDVEINSGCRAEGKFMSDLALPEGALALLVKRKDGDDLIPHGSYVYTAGHQLFLIAKTGTEKNIKEIFGFSESHPQKENQTAENT